MKKKENGGNAAKCKILQILKIGKYIHSNFRKVENSKS